jgi:hypothetical protein
MGLGAIGPDRASGGADSSCYAKKGSCLGGQSPLGGPFANVFARVGDTTGPDCCDFVRG